ncbi:MAG: pyrroline-5-carboxylate reductase [Dissulfurimicrobium sp.]|uniref:pyrroline-5-carboxylate reductase n=1 Tax=Dissulfurimicrobium TaxID=1769732 RepID=UPI001EDB3DDC|nr:pyrroline-5-carboxylate reductase [Dissulfurimicrobium hydrothermale]UKL13433.1 pyrroline-5-carboxylate reductase [Dissulfurimicrobium hydrothermale]
MAVEKGIGFIGGGQMAEALIKGLISAGFVSKEKVIASDPAVGRRDHLAKTYGVRATDSNKEVVSSSDIIVLAVKPQVISRVLEEINEYVTMDHLVLSIAAGIPLRLLQDGLPRDTRVVRVMPNTPALVGYGAAALSPGSFAREEDIMLARDIMGAVGIVVVLPEHLMDAVTGLSGSGPAYVFAFIEGLIDAGVREGLSRPVAAELVLQTVIGSAVMCKETGRHPSELASMVTSPGGTTIDGLYMLEKGAFKGLLMDAVRAAVRRSMELGGHT